MRLWPRRADAAPALALAAAGLSAGAGLVHVSVISAHAREYWLFALLFGIVAALQLAWAELVRRFPRDETLLLGGGLGNIAVVWAWGASRTTGVPLGPHAGEPEAVGFKDLLASGAEVALVLVVGLLLAGRAAAWVVPVAWALTAANLVAAALPGGHV